MSRTVLIVDAGIAYGSSKGQLNHYFSDVIAQTLSQMGYQPQVTRLADGWDVASEQEKLRQADALIFQTPIWWMSSPWQMKKYMDEVFGPGMISGDGRTHTAPDINYGTGGLLKGRYMLSCTWNAPYNAFEAPEEFFEGKGIDAVLFPMHKACQFLGLKPLATFMANDVMKNPRIQADVERLKAHIQTQFA